jgi:hypothetical protein
MEAYRLAKITGLLLTLAIVGSIGEKFRWLCVERLRLAA